MGKHVRRFYNDFTILYKSVFNFNFIGLCKKLILDNESTKI